MNCKNCNSPLEAQARFCAGCGTPVEENIMVGGANQTMPAAPMGFQPIEATTAIPPQQPMPLVINPQSLSQQPQHMEQARWPQPDNYVPSGGAFPYTQQQASPYPLPGQESPSAQTTPLLANAKLQPATGATPHRPRKPRSLGGCFLRLIAVLVLLFAALAGLWVFALQPYIHETVKSKLNDAMTEAVNQIPVIPPQVRPPFLPPNSITLPPITENLLQTLMKLGISPSEPVKDPVVHINEQGVRLEFSIHPNFLPFGFPCAVSFLPILDEQGNVVVRNVKLEGIASLGISPDDLANLLNQHISDAMKKLNNPISRIDLHQGEIVITLKI
jgi:hypothetical protein